MKEKASNEHEESKLEQRVKSLMEFITDNKAIEKTLVDQGYDYKKLPVEKLSQSMLKEGYKILSQIQKILLSIKDNRSTLSKEMPHLTKHSSEFYSTIPHNFGRQHMSNFIIKDMDTLKTKMDLVSNLIDVKAGHEIQEKYTEGSDSEEILKVKKQPNPLDATYKNLNCKIKALE